MKIKNRNISNPVRKVKKSSFVSHKYILCVYVIVMDAKSREGDISVWDAHESSIIILSHILCVNLPPPSPGLVWWGGVSGVRGAHDSPVILPLILRDIPPLSLPQVVGKLPLPV